VLVREAGDQRTYLFADGIARTFKTALATTFIEPAAEPDAEDKQRLELGVGAFAAGPRKHEARRTTATPKAIHLGLEAEILAARDAIDPHLVYADWLLGKSDPRGELIVAQHQLAERPGDKKRQQAAARILADHADYLMPAGLAASRHAESSWHLGYLDRVRLARRTARTTPLDAVLGELLAHPSARFVRGLVLGPLGDDGPYKYGPLVAAICAAPPPLLAELVIGDFTPRDTTLQFTHIGNASPLLAKLPKLRTLVLRGGTLSFTAALRHATLESLTIDTSSLATAFTKLARATLPALRTLELAAPDLSPTTTELAHLLAQLPRLRRLVLRDTRDTARLLDAILTSPQCAKLEYLGLPGGDLDDADVPRLVASAASWHHLELDVSRNRIAAVAARHLASAARTGALEVGEPRAGVPEAQLLALAPDVRVAAAAREVADSRDWLELGRDRDRVWGRFADATDFWVSAHTASHETTCTCSARRPCKHGLGLLVLAARGDRVIAERERPAAFRVAFRVRQATRRRPR
jgi:uncharacterized protein (TIGR02996 family)